MPDQNKKKADPTYDQVEAALLKMQKEQPERFEMISRGLNQSLELRRKARNERFVGGMERGMKGFQEDPAKQHMPDSHDRYYAMADQNVGAPLDPRQAGGDELIAGYARELLGTDPNKLRQLLDLVNNSPEAVNQIMTAR